MKSRKRKIQSRYKVSGTVGNRRMSVSPSLELSGNWFKAAGFAPGQLVNIETRNGEIIIRSLS